VVALEPGVDDHVPHGRNTGGKPQRREADAPRMATFEPAFLLERVIVSSINAAAPALAKRGTYRKRD
jgi:hypothetical protein